MNPILHYENSTHFETNGIGLLNDVTECRVVEGLNGEYELFMTLLTSDKYFKYLQIGSIIVVKPNLYDKNQAFVVESISKDIDGIVEVYATHIAQHRAKLIPINNYSASNLAQAITLSMTNSLETNPFNLTTNKTSSATFKIDEPRSFRELLGGRRGSLLDVYGGEYYWDNFDIQLLSRRGQDTNVRILYGLNMVELDVDDEFSFDTSITGILPIWFSEEDGLVKGSIQYSSNASSEAYAKTIVVDMSDYFENKPTASQLNTRAQSLVASRGLDKKNIKVSFAQIQQYSTGNNLQKVESLQLGDIVTIYYELYEVYYQSRIIEYDFDVLLERYNSMTVGDKRTTVSDAISTIAESVVNDFDIVASDVKYSNIMTGFAPLSNNVQGALDSAYLAQRGTMWTMPSRNIDDWRTQEYFGTWYVVMGAQGYTGTKPPTTAQGIMIIKAQSDDYVRQIFQTNGDNKIFNRYYNSTNSTWSDWVQDSISTNLGRRTGVQNSTNVSTTNGAWTEVATLTLPAGTYVVSFGATFANNATGRRAIMLYLNNSSNYYLYEAQNAVSGAVTAMMNKCGILQLTAETTLSLRCWQNSGSALNVGAKSIVALRII